MAEQDNHLAAGEASAALVVVGRRITLVDHGSSLSQSYLILEGTGYLMSLLRRQRLMVLQIIAPWLLSDHKFCR